MKVVLDANIVLAFLLTHGFIISSIFDYWDKNTFTLLISEDIFEEYSAILERLVEQKLINKRETKSLLQKIKKKSKKVKVVSKLSVSPDKKDNRYLECAKDGKANYLVSRDKSDLLSLNRFEYTKCITAKAFLNELKNQDFS